MKILAIDLGGMSSKIGLLHGEKIIKRWNIKTDLNNIFQNIKDNLKGLKDEDYDEVSFATPGFLNPEKGIIKLSGNLGLKDFDVQKELSEIFKNKKLHIINDANAAALGEFWKGAGKDFKSIAFYTIGTGIGGGLVINGNLIYGQDGYAGEFGHGGNFQNEYECTCGLKHCIEPVSSATGIERALTKHFKKETTLESVAQDFIKGDIKIKEIIKKALIPLAHHIATIELAINPEAIIIGGGPTAMGEPLRKLIEENVKEVQLDFISSSTPILLATTKNDAGVYGAAYWAMLCAIKK